MDGLVGSGAGSGGFVYSFSLTHFVWWLSLIDVGKAFISRIVLFIYDDKCSSSYVC